MIPNPTSIIAILILGTSIIVLIMLLPAFLELKKPKDAGPRRIMDNIPRVQIGMVRAIRLVSIEEEQKFDAALIRLLANVLGVLPNLEV
jgi:hypothetical protein